MVFPDAFGPDLGMTTRSGRWKRSKNFALGTRTTSPFAEDLHQLRRRPIPCKHDSLPLPPGDPTLV